MGRPGRNGIRGNLCRGRVRRRGARVCASGRPCPAAFLPSCSGNAVKTNKRTDATKAAGEAEFVASVLSFLSFEGGRWPACVLFFAGKAWAGCPSPERVAAGRRSVLREALEYSAASTRVLSAKYFPVLRTVFSRFPFSRSGSSVSLLSRRPPSCGKPACWRACAVGGQDFTQRVPSSSSSMLTFTASAGRRSSTSSGHSMKQSAPL